ncbi:MAG: hypothetical protein LQ350_003196 [Teloschistes chrysophthalmus]|nr:MAG: hypothetical protein LQ350_003196 [Niorma chrysophthalma]
MADECTGLKITVGILVTILVIILFAAAFCLWRYYKRHGGDNWKLDRANMELDSLRKKTEKLNKEVETLCKEMKELCEENDTLHKENETFYKKIMTLRKQNETLRNEKQDVQDYMKESLASSDPAADRHPATSDTSKSQGRPNGKQKEEETTHVPQTNHMPNPIHVDDETPHRRRWYGDTGVEASNPQQAFQPAPPRLHRPLTSSSIYSQPSRTGTVPASPNSPLLGRYNAAEASGFGTAYGTFPFSDRV